MSILTSIVKKKVEAFAAEKRARRARRMSEDSSSDAPSPVSDVAHNPQEPEPYLLHLNLAYEAYKAVSKQEQEKLWRIAALRVLAEEEEAHGATRKRLEKAEQLLAHQAAQVKRLSSIQQPREFLLNPTSATPLPPKAAESVVAQVMNQPTGEAAAAAFNADALIAKWKPSVANNPGFQKSFLSVFEAAASLVAAAEMHTVSQPQPDTQDLNGELNRDPSEDHHSVPATRHQSANGNSRMFHDGGTPAGSSIAQSGAGNSHTILGAAHEGDSVDASGEEDHDVSAPPLIPGGASAARSHLSARGGLRQDVLDPNLRSGAAPIVDQGEFGAEALMQKLSEGMEGDAHGAGSRRRGKR